MDRLSHSTRTWAEWSENKRQQLLKQFYNTIVLILLLCQSSEDPNMRKTVFNAFWMCPWQNLFLINTWYEYRAMYYVCGYLLRFELNFIKFNDIPQSITTDMHGSRKFLQGGVWGKIVFAGGGSEIFNNVTTFANLINLHFPGGVGTTQPPLDLHMTDIPRFLTDGRWHDFITSDGI